jgi:D-alanyl-D-alanine carboxypeptidase
MTRLVRLTVVGSLLVGILTQCVEAQETLSDRLSSYMVGREREGFSGAVLVARGADVLLRGGYGFADLELGVRNTPETVFRIGSVTKTMVATAALRLVDRERLSLDDPLVEYIPNIPRAWRSVTVENLLSHTSGIPDLFGEVASGPPGDLRALVDSTLRESQDLALRSEPGSQYSYDNFGYLLLAYVMEVADGRPWLEVLQREVISPAGLRDTRYDDVWEIVQGRARGYERNQNRMLNTPYKDHGALSAGGLLSTVDDLRRFMGALEGGRLLPPGLQARMHTPVRGDYGLGLQITSAYGHPMVNHTGGIGGFAAHIAYYPEDGLFVAVLSNVEDEPVKAIGCDLAAVVFGTQSTVLDRRLAADADRAWIDRVTGAYVDENGVARTVERQEGDVMLRRGSSAYTLVPIGFRVFAVEGSPGLTVSFEGPTDKPAVSCTARACGSVLFTARRRKP